VLDIRLFLFHSSPKWFLPLQTGTLARRVSLQVDACIYLHH
jgi:hypothetical protein